MESAETPHEFQAIYGNHLPAGEAGPQDLGRLGISTREDYYDD